MKKKILHLVGVFSLLLISIIFYLYWLTLEYGIDIRAYYQYYLYPLVFACVLLGITIIYPLVRVYRDGRKKLVDGITYKEIVNLVLYLDTIINNINLIEPKASHFNPKKVEKTLDKLQRFLPTECMSLREIHQSTGILEEIKKLHSFYWNTLIMLIVISLILISIIIYSFMILKFLLGFFFLILISLFPLLMVGWAEKREGDMMSRIVNLDIPRGELMRVVSGIIEFISENSVDDVAVSLIGAYLCTIRRKGYCIIRSRRKYSG